MEEFLKEAAVYAKPKGVHLEVDEMGIRAVRVRRYPWVAFTQMVSYTDMKYAKINPLLYAIDIVFAEGRK